MIALGLLLACQEPFGSDRHTLEGDRIAAVRVVEEPKARSAEALLVVDGRLWSDHPVEIAWDWLPAGADPATWTGDAPTTDARFIWTDTPIRPELLLIARFPSGEERRAVVGAAGPSPTVSLEVARLDATARDLVTASVAERARWSGEPGRVVEPGGALRLTDLEDPSQDRAPTRWMTTAGTWFELDPVTADWLAADAVIDDGELVRAPPLDPGPVSLVGLHPEPGRGGGWWIGEVWVGAPNEPGAFVADRWLAGAVDGWQLATLLADDAAPTGLRATEVVAASEADPDPEVPPACLGGAFHPDALVTGRCLRSELVGARVKLHAVVAP